MADDLANDKEIQPISNLPFYISLAAMFCPFFFNEIDFSYFVIYDYLLMIPVGLAVILNFTLSSGMLPRLSRILLSFPKILSVVYGFICVFPMYEINVYYSGADNFFFSDARALPDIGYYLFIFSCILAIYCINNRDFLKEK